MEQIRATGYFKFYFYELWKLGWHAMRATVIVEAALGVLIFLAIILVKASNPEPGSTLQQLESLIDSVAWWWYLLAIAAIAAHLYSIANYAAFRSIEERAIAAEKYQSDVRADNAVREIVEEQFEDPGFGDITEHIVNSGGFIRQDVNQAFYEWIRRTHARIAAISEHWAEVFGGTTDITENKVELTIKECIRRRRNLLHIKQAISSSSH